MGKLLNRDFQYNGIKYHINDNPYHNEYEGKYKLMYWVTYAGRWQSAGTFNTIKGAKEFIKKLWNE